MDRSRSWPRFGAVERKAGWRERGAAAVEFALIAPLFFILLFAIIDFGALLQNKISLSNAARVGARYGSLSASNATSSQTKAVSAATGMTSCPSPSASASYSGGSPNEITMTVSCTYTAITPLGHFLSGLVLPSSLSATTKMVVE